MIERTYMVNDVVDSEFLRLPLSLLANPKYKKMSLEAKFIYSLLLNRMTLSQRNDWINADNEVYLIYTREEAANTLNISYKKAIAAFKELIQNGLLYEQRQGLGYPNLLYVLKAELNNEDAKEFSESFHSESGKTAEKDPESPSKSQICQNDISRPVETAYPDMPKSHIRTSKNGTSRTTETEVQDMLKPHTSKINNIKTENRKIENSPSFCRSGNMKTKASDGQADEITLQEILQQCSLHMFQKNIRVMLIQAIERLYYTENLKIGNARLPQAKVRSYLNLLNEDILISVLNTMKENEQRIINPTAYLMSMIINTICEKESELILNLPSQYVNDKDFYTTDEGDDKDAYD